jgi:hypothetical protein
VDFISSAPPILSYNNDEKREAKAEFRASLMVILFISCVERLRDDGTPESTSAMRGPERTVDGICDQED